MQHDGVMDKSRKAIWLHQVPMARIIAIPLVSGPADVVQRVMRELARIHEQDEALDIVQSGRVQSLEICTDGSATLTLRLGHGLCHSAHVVAEQVFDVLRVELPDTDLYLRHDAGPGCVNDAASAEAAHPA